MRNVILILAITLLFTGSIYSQNPDRDFFKYKLVESSTLQPVSYASIYNESKRHGTISDTAGKFSIYAQPGDTLIFIALGYLGKYYIVSEHDKDMVRSITLSFRSYPIQEVSIEFPRTYLQFKKAMLEVNTEESMLIKELPRYNPFKTPYLLDTNIIYSASFQINHPISALYYKHSKIEKSKRKVWHLQQQSMKQNRVDAKYNRRIVAEATGFEGNELINFMGYCNFSFNYLFEATSLEIMSAINEKKEAYLQCCYPVN